ncbi:MAG: lysophospholipid acyltransferase family protein [Porticoccaceae bacterium]|nr:lysophospholipid acyltransferase family protein [Porticoccaceae bacterium]
MKDFLLRGFIATASRLPLRLARLLGRLLGDIAWYCNIRETALTRVNIALCWPTMSAAEQVRLARASLRHWGMTIFEVPIIWRKGRGALDLIGTVHGAEAMARQLASGRGTIMLSPHLGNWELAGLWASSHGPTTILYQPPKQESVEKLVRTGRGKAGATLVPTNLRGVTALIKALKKGEITGILPDMVPDLSGGVVAPFFGHPAFTMTLIHSLQQRSGAGILLAFAQRTTGGFDIHVLEPDDDIYSTSPEESAAALNRLVEQSVLIAPEQYQWEYKRFRDVAEGQPAVYPKREKQ